jgi:hypothetical protein
MSSWSSPLYTFQSASLPAGTNNGTPLDFTKVLTSFSAQITLSAGATVYMEGSYDGVNWYLVTVPVSVGAGVVLLPPIINPARYVRGVVETGSAITADFQIIGTEQNSLNESPTA